MAIAGDSKLPRSFKPVAPYAARKVVLPKGALRLSRVSRVRAELREGPGSQFKLQGKWLQRGDKVIVFNRVAAWYKVLTIQSKKQGWMHYKALGSFYYSDRPTALSVHLLPRVFSIRKISSVYLNPSKTQVAVNIPKGRAFAALQIDQRRTLVWVRETDSVLWLNSEDAR